jgi:hypothetical protein
MTAEPPATGDGGRVAAPTAEASDDVAARPDATDRLPALRRAYGFGR